MDSDSKSSESLPEKNNGVIEIIDDQPVENSPYESVRACVEPYDDTELPVNTIRVWVIGVIGIMVLTALNQFFQLHSPPLFLTSYIVILATYPLGLAAAKVLPTRYFNIFGLKFTLNPGPFNKKEHAIIGIMGVLVTAYDNGSLASDVYVAFDKYYGMPISIGYKFMFLLSTQALSFAFAGIFRHFLVEPAYCIWPGSLPTVTMLNSFHDPNFENQIAHGWKIHRHKFFAIVCVCSAVYYFIPGYLFTALSTFAWITWIKPNNVTLNQVFGASSGMDLLPLTLDWNMLSSYLLSPLVMPWWAQANIIVGAVIFLWIIGPALHWSNVWYGQYFPYVSSSVFDNTGSRYSTASILTPDYHINNTAYHEYSPIFLSTTSVLSYGLGFAAVSSVVVQAILYHREEIWKGMKETYNLILGRKMDSSNFDIHAKLMHKYPQVPEWWYLIVLAANAAICFSFIYVYDTGLPWWGLIVAVVIDLILMVPIGIMLAMCNLSINTGNFAGLIGGYIWPGKVVTNVVFKIFMLVCTNQGLGYINDMKIGHYMKVPPRITFAAQCVGITVSFLTQTAVNQWAMGNVDGICTTSETFGCPLAAGYYSNSMFWGLIGPTKIFARGSMYRPMLWFFLIGAVLPVITYLISKKYPKSWTKHVYFPAFFSATMSIPPATAANYMAWGAVGWFFGFYIRRKYHAWWVKYNYILSAGLDAGLAVGIFFVFFCLTLPKVNLTWWGNTIADTTADGMGTPLKIIPEGQTIGPTSWK